MIRENRVKTVKTIKTVSLMSILVIVMISIFSFSLPLLGGRLKSKGEVSVEGRLFQGDHIEITQDNNLSLFSRLETTYRSGAFRAGLRFFGRVDSKDRDRSIFAVEEAWIGYRKSGWEIKLGAQMLNWSATEAFHPADMMNSRLLDSDVENQEKLGELMLSVGRKIGRGKLTLYVMPRYRSPEFPSPVSRVSFLPPRMEVGNVIWVEGDGEVSDDSYGFQYGARFTQTIGSADVNLHFIRHQDRHQPVMIPGLVAGTPTGKLIPVYLPVNDIGGTYLHVFGDWIFKLEYNYRDFINPGSPVFIPSAGWVPVSQPDHHQLALGIEYGWAYSGGSEATLIVEGQGLLGVDKETRARLHPFQRDVLIGYRHAWNDVMSRELLVTTIFDLERKREFLFNVSYKQRLSDTWGLRLGFRIVDAPKKGNIPTGLEALHKSNQVFFVLTKYF